MESEPVGERGHDVDAALVTQLPGSDNGAPVFEVDGLEKAYGTTRALGGVDLRVGAGELVGLLGPNGAGKSTLVKIGCGLVRPTSGSASVCGHPAGSDEARAAVGYLAEMFRFQPWLKAAELIRLHQRLSGSSGGESEADELLQLVGLGAVKDRPVSAMSKGMQQRLGLAQALVGSPRLLMLDEPTSALDPAGRADVRRILEEVRARGISVLLNSHLLTEVELVCDRVVILSRGSVIAQGTPEELSSSRGVEVDTASGTMRWPDATRAQIPALVANLVAEGAEVFGVRMLKTTLEDVYIEALGSESR